VLLTRVQEGSYEFMRILLPKQHQSSGQQLQVVSKHVGCNCRSPRSRFRRQAVQLGKFAGSAPRIAGAIASAHRSNDMVNVACYSTG
jgi:hypothetical protein